MSLYDGISVETAPIPEIAELTKKKDEENWSSGFQLMASQLQRNKISSSRKPVLKPKPQISSAILEKSGGPTIIEVEEPKVMYIEEDYSFEVEDEYDPAEPNSYSNIVRERKEEQDRFREEERKRRWEERERDRRRRRRRSDGDSSDSDDESSRKSRKKDSAAAIPPPIVLSSQPPPEEKTVGVVLSALEELSKKKAIRKNTIFSKPRFGAVASKIMSKYGWEEGQGLGKTSQGISTALSVEKTSKRGGKIVNASAEIEEEMEQDKKKLESMADVMKSPSKVVLLLNMVGPGEVDDDLEPETAEECRKYGAVEKCVIYEIQQGADDDEAVRIFVEFCRLESAIKAVIDLNGRYFGGRTVRASFFNEDRFSKLDLAP